MYAVVYEAPPGQCSVPESSNTASVKTISTPTVPAEHMTMPSPRPRRQITGQFTEQYEKQIQARARNPKKQTKKKKTSTLYNTCNHSEYLKHNISLICIFFNKFHTPKVMSHASNNNSKPQQPKKNLRVAIFQISEQLKSHANLNVFHEVPQLNSKLTSMCNHKSSCKRFLKLDKHVSYFHTQISNFHACPLYIIQSHGAVNKNCFHFYNFT